MASPCNLRAALLALVFSVSNADEAHCTAQLRPTDQLLEVEVGPEAGLSLSDAGSTEAMNSTLHQDFCPRISCKESSEGKPGFLFVGCQRCGMSAVRGLLRQHPCTKVPTTDQEMFFWKGEMKGIQDIHKFEETEKNALHYANGSDTVLTDYLTQMPNTTCDENQTTDHVTGEFSTTYFECVTCPKVFRKAFPNAKIIIQLREPMSRAMSRFTQQHSRSFNNGDVKNLTWHSYLKDNLGKLKDCLAGRNWTTGRAICSSNDQILGWSNYADILARWFEAGYNSKNLKIVYYEEFRHKPKVALQSLEAFLELPAFEDYQGIYGKAQTENMWSLKKRARAYNRDFTPAQGQVIPESEAAALDRDLVDFFRGRFFALDQMLQNRGMAPPPARWRDVFDPSTAASKGVVKAIKDPERPK